MSKRITSAGLSDYHHRRFLGWAFSDGKAKGTLARDIVVARTESNATIIDEKLQFFANRYKISVETLLDRLVKADEDGINFTALRKDLAREAGIEEDGDDGDEA